MAAVHGPVGYALLAALSIGAAGAHWLNARGKVIGTSRTDDTGVDWKKHPQRWAAAHRRTLPAMLIGVLLGVVTMGIAVANGYDRNLEFAAVLILAGTLLGTFFVTRRFLKQDSLELVKEGKTTIEEIEEKQEEAQRKAKDTQMGKLWVALILLVGVGIYALVNGHL